MARKTSIILIAAMLAALTAPSGARAQSASDLNSKAQPTGDLNNVDCGPIMKALRGKTPHSVATDLNVPAVNVYNCMQAARAARIKRIGEPGPRASGAGTAATATPAPTPAM